MMTYNKPEIAVLGNAAQVIQQQNPKRQDTLETFPPNQPINPDAAYDVDE